VISNSVHEADIRKLLPTTRLCNALVICIDGDGMITATGRAQSIDNRGQPCPGLLLVAAVKNDIGSVGFPEILHTLQRIVVLSVVQSMGNRVGFKNTHVTRYSGACQRCAEEVYERNPRRDFGMIQQQTLGDNPT